MKVAPNVICGEFIGTDAKIVKSQNASCIGLLGEVINETKNTLTILHKGKAKNIVKGSSVFHFTFSDGTIAEIDGKLLVGRPEDRLKKNVKRLW